MLVQTLYGVTLEGGTANTPSLRAIFADEREAVSFSRLLALKSDPMEREVRVRPMAVPFDVAKQLNSSILKDVQV